VESEPSGSGANGGAPAPMVPGLLVPCRSPVDPVERERHAPVVKLQVMPAKWLPARSVTSSVTVAV
jgi:hypothetical protein